MTSLSPLLHRNGFFAPATWAADNASDLDLGSTEPVSAAGDPNSALTVGKRGVGYLLSTAHLSGIGHKLASRTICRSFGGELSPATGAIRSQIEIGAGLPHFSSLSLAGGTAYVSTLTGVSAVNGA